MITNPAAAMRMLITYVICIPLAVMVGYLLTNPLDFGTLGFLGIVAALILSPIFIKWHYPIMVFALSSPIMMFFLKGNPPFSQVMVFLSLGIALVERTVSSERRFISVPSITWPLISLLAVVVFTAELTGGIDFHSLSGGDSGVVGGGRKYLLIFTGIATYFALSSRPIAPQRRRLYLALFYLPGLLVGVSDVFSNLPSPLSYINLLIPADIYSSGLSELGQFGTSFKRFAGLAGLASAILTFMLARYGLRGMIASGRLWRVGLLAILCFVSLAGGFRSSAINLIATLGLLFLFEGLHRTRLLPVVLMGLVSLCVLLVPFAGKLPYSIQRSLVFLPLSNLDPQAVLDAQGSTEWRLNMWSYLWPQVPDHLLLGKGFGLTKDDYMVMGAGNTLAAGAEHFDASSAGLAVSSDYHNGPLSTLIPFGIWGAIAFLWLVLAGLRLLYRNYKYGDPDLKLINRFLLIAWIIHWFNYLFIFGAFQMDIITFATQFGFSVALNGGMRGPAAEPAFAPRIKPVPSPQTA